jgi:phenylpropionate dioxygenase-like ring-hydroxylating dioxygenase large terminal subunit
MFLRNVWYVAAWAQDLPSEGMLARKFLNERVILYRDTKGAVHALRDQCPHRAAPLSVGRREGDSIRCMYHGLLFDGAGKCIEVPGVERIPPNLDVQAFPVREQDNIIWIWMGDPALSLKEGPVRLEATSSPDKWFYEPGYLHYNQASYQLIMDNLLDFSHLGFVHENTISGGTASSEVRAQIERFETGVKISRKYYDPLGVPPAFKPLAKFTGPADRWQIYDWRVPGNLLIMESGNARAGVGALEGNIPEDAIRFSSVQALTPETETSTHYFFMQAHDDAERKEEFNDILVRGVKTAFLEDRAMIEAQQRVLIEEPDAPMNAIPADAALNQGRWILKRLLEAENKVSAVA